MGQRKYAIIGSAAIKWHDNDAREPRDIDVIMYKRDYNSFLIDIGGQEKKNNGEAAIVRAVDYVEGDDGTVREKDIVYEVLFADNNMSWQDILHSVKGDHSSFNYVDINTLYSIKKAHIHYPKLKFEKHIKDLIYLRKKIAKDLGYDYTDTLLGMIDILDINPTITAMHRKATELRLGKIRTPRLYNKPVDEFFEQSKDYVKSYYIHDNMHRAMAHLSHPAYELMQKDKTKADCDMKMWYEMTLQQKQYCVLEEAYVIALERKILPQMFEDIECAYSELDAFKWALMRICTNLCSGFFRWFSTINYEEILNQYDPGYVNKFFKNIKNFEKDLVDSE